MRCQCLVDQVFRNCGVRNSEVPLYDVNQFHLFAPLVNFVWVERNNLCYVFYLFIFFPVLLFGEEVNKTRHSIYIYM